MLQGLCCVFWGVDGAVFTRTEWKIIQCSHAMRDSETHGAIQERQVMLRDFATGQAAELQASSIEVFVLFVDAKICSHICRLNPILTREVRQ